MNKYNLIIASLTVYVSGNLFAGGDKVPDGQQCQKFCGNVSTPRIRVNNIPKASNAIVVDIATQPIRLWTMVDMGKLVTISTKEWLK